MSERTNGPRNGSNCGDERNSNKRMKTSPGKKRAHFDNGLVYENQRYLRGSVGFGEPSLPDHRGKRRHLRVRTDTREAQITRTSIDSFQLEHFSLFL